jgi:hypothetical protein
MGGVDGRMGWEGLMHQRGVQMALGLSKVVMKTSTSREQVLVFLVFWHLHSVNHGE